MDLFDKKAIKPMLISKQVPAFNSSDYIYELKQDGIRCINYVDENSIDLRNKRDMILTSKFPELSEIYENVKGKAILDGELIVLKNGVPDFYELQRRVMLTDSFKIQLAAKKLPASYVAYDIIYHDGKEVTELPLLERKLLLNSIIEESKRIAISRYIREFGIELYNLTCEQELEGVVAKEINSKYFFDKRSKDWLKIKRMADEDFVICGYILKESSNTLVLGQYDGNSLIYKGNVTLGVKLDFIEEYDCKRVNESPFTNSPEWSEKVEWLKPELVCVVEYMPNTKDRLRQAVFKGIRDDVMPYDCKVK